jgi:hypothetical protein
MKSIKKAYLSNEITVNVNHRLNQPSQQKSDSEWTQDYPAKHCPLKKTEKYGIK